MSPTNVTKGLESLVKDILMNHLLNNKLIRDGQHGFMPGKLCAGNLVEFIDRIKVVNLKAKGVDTHMVKWIVDWLTNGNQKISVRGSLSTKGLLCVSHGNVVNPKLFFSDPSPTSS